MSVDAIGVNSSRYESASSGVAKKRVAVGLTVGTAAASGGLLGYLAFDKYAKRLKETAGTAKRFKTAGAVAGAVVSGGVMAAIAGKALKMGKVKRSKDKDINFVVTTTDGHKIEYPFMMGVTTKIIPLPNKRYAVFRTPVVPNPETKSKIMSEEQLLNEYSEFVI